MSSSADEAREDMAEQRKGLIEISLKWLFKLADWLFPPPYFKKKRKKKTQ